jgi:serine/threonine protein phosphatase 1
VHNCQRVHREDGFRSWWVGRTEGEYCFVHAEVLPSVPLEKQKEENLLWIRGKFLDFKANHRKVVAKGHTIRPEPEVLLNRIGIDTGAYSSGILTCLALEKDSQSFL